MRLETKAKRNIEKWIAERCSIENDNTETRLCKLYCDYFEWRLWVLPGHRPMRVMRAASKDSYSAYHGTTISTQLVRSRIELIRYLAREFGIACETVQWNLWKNFHKLKFGIACETVQWNFRKNFLKLKFGIACETVQLVFHRESR